MLSTECLAILCQLPLMNFLWVTILYNLSYIWTTFIIWKSLFGINNPTPTPKKKSPKPCHICKWNAYCINHVLDFYTFTILGHDILNFYRYLHWSSWNHLYQEKSFKAFYTVYPTAISHGLFEENDIEVSEAMNHCLVCFVIIPSQRSRI